jgi:hypothetical protein
MNSRGEPSYANLMMANPTAPKSFERYIEAENHNKIKFLVEISDGDFDEIISYDTLCDLVENQNDDIIEEEKTWNFKSIQGQQGPLKKNDPNYKCSSYNVLVEWEDGSNTYEPLDLIIRLWYTQ